LKWVKSHCGSRHAGRGMSPTSVQRVVPRSGGLQWLEAIITILATKKDIRYNEAVL